MRRATHDPSHDDSDLVQLLVAAQSVLIGALVLIFIFVTLKALLF